MSQDTTDMLQTLTCVEARHIRDILDERDRRYEQRFAAQEKAIEVAQAAQLRHDERANGLQIKLDEQHKTFLNQLITKDEYERRHQDLVDKIDQLRDFKSDIDGRETAAKMMGRLLAFIAGVVLALFAAWMKTR